MEKATLSVAQADAPLVVCDGKYAFQKNPDGWRIDVLRYGESWLTIAAGNKAIAALMFELAEARATLGLMQVERDWEWPEDLEAYVAELEAEDRDADA